MELCREVAAHSEDSRLQMETERACSKGRLDAVSSTFEVNASMQAWQRSNTVMDLALSPFSVTSPTEMLAAGCGSCEVRAESLALQELRASRYGRLVLNNLDPQKDFQCTTHYITQHCIALYRIAWNRHALLSYSMCHDASPKYLAFHYMTFHDMTLRCYIVRRCTT